MPVLKVTKGLSTFENELNGTEDLDIADNCVIDADDTIQSRRGFADFGNSFGTGSDRLKQLFTYKERILRHFNSTLQFDSNGSGSFSSFSGSYNELDSGLRIKGLEANSNFYFTASDGIKKISARTASDFSTSSNYITNAGGVKAADVSAELKFAVGGFLPPQSKVAYRIVWGIKDRNNNLILGSPSARFVLSNTSQDVNTAESFTIDFTTASETDVAGKYILFSSQNNDYFLWFKNTGNPTQPATAETLARTPIEADIDGLGVNTADIIAVAANAIATLASEFSVEISGTNIIVTSLEEGQNITDAALQSGGITNLTLTVDVQGSVATGSSANATITFTVPQDINSLDYFYQIFRSAPVTVTQGLTLDDIDPGDELNLAYESGITQSEIDSGLVVVDDITTEEFRASGVFLYTNPNTGQGILQANERPPIAKDVALFKNSVFYADTKTTHKLQFNLLSVASFTSGVSNLIIGNDEITREYTFVGDTQTFDITTDTKANTLGNSYFLANSALNERKYYFWLDKGIISHSFDSTTDVDDSTEEITITAHGFANNEEVVATGTLPGGLTSGNIYYVIFVDANTIQLALTPGGPAIDLTDAAGTGTLTHTPTDPLVVNRIGVRVDISSSVTAANVAETLNDVINLMDDFDSTVSTSIVSVTLVKNGNTDTPTFSTPSPGGLWAITITNFGDGEGRRGSFTSITTTNPAEFTTSTNHGMESGDKVFILTDNTPAIDGEYTATVTSDNEFTIPYDNSLGVTDTGRYYQNDVLLSSLVSVGQAIDETARSLVRVINRDPESPVNATYLSGPDDLPGIILLENRSLEDKPFYLSTSDPAIATSFNPELSPTEVITNISIANPTTVTSAGHGLVTGEEIYIYATDSIPALLGRYTVTVTSINDFTVPVNVTTAGTTGIWFKADVASDNEVSPNRVYYSKVNQPEAVPIVNFLDIGPKDKKIQRIVALRDSLFVLKEDGVYIITGTTAPDFGFRLLDNSAQIFAPDTAAVLNNQIYCLTTQGVSTITDGGVSIVSRTIEDRILSFANNRTNYKTLSFGVTYESDRAYMLWAPTKTIDTVATQCYRYNTFTRTWTRWTNAATCGVVGVEIDKLYIGDGTRNYLLQERKLGDRTDYADRDFPLSIPSGSVSTAKTIILSSTADLDIGDVLVQTQYVTIAQFNRLLKKLDIDLGLDDSDYYSTLAANPGDNLANKLTSLASKLNADDSNITAQVFSSDFETMQTEYNVMISELNDSLSDTTFKNYSQSSGTLTYEVIVLANKVSQNLVTVNTYLPILEGPIQAFKHIEMIVQWAPQHFGDPSILKQIREGTVLFDQNNFYSAEVSYATDISQNFDMIPFLGRGVGYWGDGVWGEFTWGGLGSEVPFRTLVPLNKQRCRHIRVKFRHINAREIVRVLGITLEPRPLSKRAYR